MKKVIILGVFLLLGLYFDPSLAKADVPMGPGYHYVDSCVKITNLNEFPDIIFIADYTGASADGTKGFLINNNECIKEGYKFSSLYIFWVTKDKFKSIDLNNIKVNSSYIPVDLNLLSARVPFYAGELEDSTHIKAIITEYLIKQNNNSLMSLNKSKETTEYNNGTSNKVETFSNSNNNQNVDKKEINNNQNQETPKPVKRGFWRTILCFFGFSKSC